MATPSRLAEAQLRLQELLSGKPRFEAHFWLGAVAKDYGVTHEARAVLVELGFNKFCLDWFDIGAGLIPGPGPNPSPGLYGHTLFVPDTRAREDLVRATLASMWDAARG